jgi:peptidyl-prolyl cis-trans isomerase D
VKAKYEASKARWDKPKRVKARHVLAKVDDGAPADQVAAAKKKADDALARVKKGEDFAKVAKELSDDRGSAERGGDVGEFGPGVMAKPFEDAAFAAKKGELVGPVKTSFGFHVIEVTGVQEAQSIPLEQAKNEVARELLEEQRAATIAKKRADDALAQAKGGKALANAEETGLFGAGSPVVPRIGLAADLQKAALAASTGQVLGVFDTAAGPIVARVKARQRPDPAQFEAKKAEVAERLRAQRESQVEEAFVKALREKASVKVNEKVAGAPAGLLGG